jgi:hypothetical protein
MLDQLVKGDLDRFNAKAKLPSAEQLVKNDIDRFNAQAKLPGANQYLPPEPEPDWRTMTMDECIAAVDAKLAKRDQELSPHEMFEACDLATKGFSAQMITRPRQGRERVHSEVLRTYAVIVPAA